MSKEDSKGKGRGFAGLAEIAPPPPSPRTPPLAPKPSAPPPPSPQTANSTPGPSRQPPAALPPNTKGKTDFTPWVVGAIVLGVIWLFASNSSESSSRPSSYTPSDQAAAPAPSYVPPPPAPPAAESPPPAGITYALDDSQLRYCIAQKIRVTTWEGATTADNNADIDRFNARVEDYNSRCGHFKYRRGALERVTAEVEQDRSRIESIARATWIANRPVNPDPAARSYSPAAPAYPAYPIYTPPVDTPPTDTPTPPSSTSGEE
jgi:hypothetical protein